MSLNAALNATVALIEGRTDIAREILRGPASDVKNVPEILARLNRAVDKIAAKAIRNALLSTLALQPDEQCDSTAQEDAYYRGVAAAESILERAASNLEES